MRPHRKGRRSRLTCFTDGIRLNQVTVAATDLERAEGFYRLLGLRLIVRDHHYLRFECPVGDATFSVELTPDPAVDEHVTIYFETERLDAEYERLATAGVAFDQPPTHMAWLWREARLRDPDGHRICLYHAGDNRKHPPWRLDPQTASGEP
jgi:catechol 2,3-dioxygenase-like lactoylglutathione lyase family enzyme